MVAQGMLFLRKILHATCLIHLEGELSYMGGITRPQGWRKNETTLKKKKKTVTRVSLLIRDSPTERLAVYLVDSMYRVRLGHPKNHSIPGLPNLTHKQAMIPICPLLVGCPPPTFPTIPHPMYVCSQVSWLDILQRHHHKKSGEHAPRKMMVNSSYFRPTQHASHVPKPSSF